MSLVKPAVLENKESDGTYSTNPLDWEDSDSYGGDYYLSDDEEDFEPTFATVSIAEQEDAAPNKPMREKTLSWGNLEEICFAVEKGDPSIYELAYPLQLSNQCMFEKQHTIDDYEEERVPHRRPSEELRTKNSEERRKIIKASNKAFAEFKKTQRRQLHRRTYSIGNGQMGRLFQAAKGPLSGSQSEPQGVDDRRVQSERLYFDQDNQSSSRPTLRRQNSIGNGQISRDKRRNLVQDFLSKLTKIKK